MSTALSLPPSFLATATFHYKRKNFYRDRLETGGYLVGHRATPNVVAFCTGPGANSEHTEGSVTLSRDDIEAAVGASGHRVIGCWHCHPTTATTEPSPEDRATWNLDLLQSFPRLDSWASVIIRHDGERWADLAGWRTTRQGCAPVEVTPTLARSRELASDLAWVVNRTALVEPPTTWTKEPDRLRSDLELLDAQVATLERDRLKDLNTRLKRLGFEGNLKPLPPAPANRSGETIIWGDGTCIVRTYETKITVR